MRLRVWTEFLTGIIGFNICAAGWLLANNRQARECAPVSPAAYRVTDLGTLPGRQCYHGGGGINAQGDVVGASTTADHNTHAFLWTAAHGIHDLGVIGGDSSYAYAVNDRRQIAGQTDTIPNATTKRYACLWQPDGSIKSLGSLPGSSCSAAMALNNRCTVVGYAYSPSDDAPWWQWHNRAFIWDSAHGMRALALPPGYSGSRAYAVNDHGDVAGWLLRGDRTRAVIWRGGRAIDIGADTHCSLSLATAIDDSGKVAGSAGNGPRDVRAFLWDGGKVTLLGRLPWHTYNKAVAMSPGQEIVGDARSGAEYMPPFVYDPGHGMRNLNTLLPASSGWYLEHVFAVNRRGQILAWGEYRNQSERMCLLTPSQSGASGSGDGA